MTVADAISSYSRGELAPVPNTFQQPGTYGTSSDSAMTDGIKHAMLHAQRAIHGRLINSYHVRSHLKKHHGATGETDTPLADHARKHTLAQLTQGHSISVDGDLYHGSTDISAGTANFAYEAPPMVSTIELIRHVRTAEGAAFYHKSIGTPLINSPEDSFANQKAKNLAAQSVEDQLKAEKAATTHRDLLSARRSARAKYPAGHPERLAAERAVRQSRRAQAHVSTEKKRADARKDPGFYSPKETVTATGPKQPVGGIGGVRSPIAPQTRQPIPSRPNQANMATTALARQQEVAELTSTQQARYFAMRNAGVMHATALSNIRKTIDRETPPPVVVKLRERRGKRS